MSEASKPIIDTLRELPQAEKIRIVQVLWDDIADQAASLPLTGAQRRLLDERIDGHRANPADIEPWDDARKDILREL